MQEPQKMDPRADAAASTELAALEGQIALLADLRARVASLRQNPAYLRPAGAAAPASLAAVVPAPGQTALIRQGFAQIKEFVDKVQSAPVQEVLTAAQERGAQDQSGLRAPRRRPRLKRERAASPESPQPQRSFQPKASPFPPEHTVPAPVRMDGLVEYVRAYNTEQAAEGRPFRLHIWTATPSAPGAAPADEATLRFTIRDVATVFLAVSCTPADPTLVVEGATAFGPREKKPPHAQSGFVVYQRLSQHLAKMLQAHPRASLPLLTMLLAAYEDLFIRQCSACGRVIGAEGHVPPVARVWVPAAERGAGERAWDARHPACVQARRAAGGAAAATAAPAQAAQ